MKLDPKALDEAYNVVAYRHTADKGVLAEAIRTYLTAIGETHVLVPRDEGWQGIATAPKDGSSIDLWVHDPDRPQGYRIPSARWDNTGLGWVYGRDNGVEFFFDAVTGMARIRATHWMLPPSPPAAAKEGE